MAGLEEEKGMDGGVEDMDGCDIISKFFLIDHVLIHTYN